MKTFEKVLLILILAAVLVLPLVVFALGMMFLLPREAAVLPVKVAVQSYRGLPGVGALQMGGGDQLVLGGVYELDEDETLDGSLVVIGGTATLHNGSRVEKDVVLLGGAVQAGGIIEGDVVAIGGLIELGETALVEGDVNIISGRLERAEGASIEGRINRSVSGPYSIPVVVPTSQVVIPGVSGGGILWDALFLLFRSFLWAIVALLIVLLLPKHSERVRVALVEKPGVAAGLGLLTVVIAPLLLVVITITVIGIPVSLFGVFVLALAWAFGVIVVGLEVGQRLARAAKQEWAPAVSAGLGAFLVTLVGNTIGAVTPCIGWMVPALVGMLGLGAVLMTRFGAQDHQPASLRPVEAVAPVEILPVHEPGEADAEEGEEKAEE